MTIEEGNVQNVENVDQPTEETVGTKHFSGFVPDGEDPTAVLKDTDKNVETQGADAEPEKTVEEEENKDKETTTENQFEGLDLDGDDSEADDKSDEEGERQQPSYNNLAKELGFDDETSFKSDKELAEAIRKKYSTPTDPVLAGLDDKAIEHIQQVAEVARNGGDFTAYTDAATQISKLEQDITAQRTGMDYYKSVYDGNDEAAMRSLLAKYYAEELNLPSSDIEEKLESMESYEIKFKAKEIAKTAMDQIGGNIKSAEDRITSLKDQQDSAVTKAKEQRELANKAYSAALDKFEDADGKTFTNYVKKQAKGLFDSDPQTVVLPKGVLNLLAGGEDGKISADVLMTNLGKILLSDKKINHLKNKSKKKNFEKLQNVEEPAKAEVEQPPKPKEEDTSRHYNRGQHQRGKIVFGT